MRFHPTAIVLPLVASFLACTAVQETRPETAPARPSARASADGSADPMAGFARMVGGEWKVTFKSGTSMYDTYRWGPDRHSGRVMTHGLDAGGNPWRGLGVVYWHPARKQLYTLSLNPFEGSISEGAVKSHVDGDRTESVSDLYQNGVHRKLVSRETFDGPDRYHSALLEEFDDSKLTPLTEWDYFRSRALTPVRPLPAENPPKPSARLKAFQPLFGRTWDARGKWGTGDPFHIESTFEWIPYIDAVYARTFALRGNGEPIHLLDAYIYHHTKAGRLRCLALSGWKGGGVYEGDVTVLEGGALQFDLAGYEGERTVPYVVQFDLQGDGTLRDRVWSVGGDGAGAQRTPMLDVHHTASEMCKGIWYVFQDANGNYWFGSDGHGVYRFDGKATTNFTTNDGLCSDRIRGIQQHKSGDILITTLEGVSKFDGQSFSTLPVTAMDSPADGWVLDPDDVWLPWQTGQKGPYRYDGKTLYHLKFPKHPREDGFYATHPRHPWSPYEVYCVYKDRKGNVWFGTANFGICRFDGKHLDWMYEEHLTEIEGGGMFGIRSILEDKDGAFWFCNTQYRYKVQPHQEGAPGPESGRIAYTREAGMDLSGTSLREKFFYFMSITEDDKRNLWMATYGGGVWRFDGKVLTHFPVKDGDRDVTLFSITKDSRGDLWLGTHEAGAYRFNGKEFEKFRP